MTEPTEPPVIEGEIVEEAPAPQISTDYTNAGVPNFDYVRDRIENRVATSIGSNELAGATPEGASLDEQFAEREKAGRDRLEQIRRSMRGE
jgi:phage shock protein A